MDIFQTVSGLGAGLALFLFGMKAMSGSLQKAAGDKMRQILEVLTSNPIMGVLAGAFVTAILQSSSATTVMVIGFVSAGLMSLKQGVSVMFGANIGTTMTAQLLAFKMSDMIYPIIFIGFMIYLFAKKQRTKEIGMVIFSFGLLFEGIEIMGGAMKPLASLPIFTQLMEQVAQIPVLGVLLGTVMTLLVQSSSATIAILQNFAATPTAAGASVLGLAGAIPILLGDNIGTCITAILASIGQSKDARRVAFAHMMFNLFGSLIALALLPLFVSLVTYLSPSGAEVDIISRQIANAHTLFNSVNTLIWLPMIGLLVKTVMFMVPDKGEKTGVSLLGRPVVTAPEAALKLVFEEIQSLSASVRAVLIQVQALFVLKNDEVIKTDLPQVAEQIARRHDAITDYITTLFERGTLNAVQSRQAASLLHVSDQMYRITLRAQEVAAIAMNESGSLKKFSSSARLELKEGFSQIIHLFNQSLLALDMDNREMAQEVLADKEALYQSSRQNTLNHLQRVQTNECKTSMVRPFSDIMAEMDRMAEACGAIAEEVMTKEHYENLEMASAQQPAKTLAVQNG